MREDKPSGGGGKAGERCALPWAARSQKRRAPNAPVCAFHPLWRSVRSGRHNKPAAGHQSRFSAPARSFTSQLAEIKSSVPHDTHAAFIYQNNKAINHN